MGEVEFNAALQEMAIQRNSMADRAVTLASQLAAALAKVKELEEKLAPQSENVVEMPPR